MGGRTCVAHPYQPWPWGGATAHGAPVVLVVHGKSHPYQGRPTTSLEAGTPSLAYSATPALIV